MNKSVLKIIKIIIVLIVTFLSLFLIITLTNEFKRLAGESILVPPNFVGFVYIVYNEKEGKSEKKDGICIYKIINSNVYLTNTEFSKRLNMYENDVRFFYYDSKDIRLQIPNCCLKNGIDTILAENTIAFKMYYALNLDSDSLFNSKPYILYQIDSMKNLGNQPLPLTKNKYLNSLKYK